MLIHEDYITHINTENDAIYLKTKHFPVNMRLFHTSPEYKAIILQQCNYIRSLCLDTKKGYKKPHGMSSANAGLAFNIIGVTMNRNTPQEYCKIFINPVIEEYKGQIVEKLSNCGSLTLANSVKVNRYTHIIVSYCDEKGDTYRQNFNEINGAFTIQHEIDHNLGILITDRKC